jgi:membrane protease subunit HflK
MKRSLTILSIATGLIAAWLFAAGWCTVAPGEVLVVRRLGRLLATPWGPGLHWHFPGFIDRLDRIRTDEVRRLTIGQAGPASVDAEPSAGEVMTGDLNLLRIEATLQYRVADPVARALRGDRAEDILARATESSLVRSLARRGVDAALRSERGQIAREVADELQSQSDGLQLGVLILGVSLTDARPPVEVAADFAEAQAAESRRDDRINVARAHEAVQLATAASRGDALREAARADASREQLTARADADRFLALLPEVRRARALTVRRLYIESVQSLLGSVRRKLVLPPGDSLDLTVLGLPGQAAATPVPRPDRRNGPPSRESGHDQ